MQRAPLCYEIYCKDQKGTNIRVLFKKNRAINNGSNLCNALLQRLMRETLKEFKKKYLFKASKWTWYQFLIICWIFLFFHCLVDHFLMLLFNLRNIFQTELLQNLNIYGDLSTHYLQDEVLSRQEQEVIGFNNMFHEIKHLNLQESSRSRVTWWDVASYVSIFLKTKWHWISHKFY